MSSPTKEDNPPSTTTSPESTSERKPEKQMTEEEIKEALECPCMDSMRDSPCGPQFMSSFECFLRSTEEEKGSDCLPEFSAMQKCFEANKEFYDKFLEDEENADAMAMKTPAKKE